MASKNVFAVNRTLSVFKNNSNFGRVSVRCSSVWTQDRIIKSPYKDIEIPNCTIYDYVWHNLDKFPEKTAAVCASTGRGFTYEQVFKLSTTFAANLRTKFHMQDGDVAAIMLPNIPDFLTVSMGVLEAGGVITTINPVYTAHEIQRQLLMSNAKLIITLTDYVETVRNALKIAKIDIPIIVVKTTGDSMPTNTISFNELSEDVHVDKSVLKKVRRSLNDVCFLPYSSGTTGLPKGVELTHKNLIANMEQISEDAIRCHNETTATHQDSILAVLPFFHIYAASVIMFHKMSIGCKIVTLSKLQPDHYFKTLEKFRINILFGAPPLILLMGSHPASTEKSLQSIEIVINGAAPLSGSDAERLVARAKKDIDFRQGYGLTETSPTVLITPRNCKNYSSTGIPIPSTEIRLVDSNLNNLGPNETGEILIRGPQVMPGYRNNPEANKEAFTTDGWFRTGDLAIADEQGYITIADRLKELIKVKGFQVPPAELEGVLRQHPSVLDAAVIGVPHPTNGEEPKAFIVLKKDQKPNTKDVVDFVNERVAPFKRISNVTVLETIPKSAAGKILRRVLKEQHC